MAETIRITHLEWCKKRALELLDKGKFEQAVTSMLSDLGKSEETADHIGIKLGSELLFGGFLNTDSKIRHWIEGFC